MDRYEFFGFVKSRLSGFVNIIDSGKRLPAGERLVYANTERSVPRRARTEQKNTNFLDEIICRLSKPSDVVVDMCGGTFSTAMTCIKIPDEQLRVFVGCEKNKECFVEAENWCVEEFSSIFFYSENSATDFPRHPPSSVNEQPRLVVSHLFVCSSSNASWEISRGLQHCLCF